jgi:hypothetical protein
LGNGCSLNVGRAPEVEITFAGAARVIGSSPFFRPKKRGPFQVVPVMALAIVERLE